MRRTMPLLTLILLLASQLRAADLTKIDRSIRKEPVYQSKSPRYCLLVFGPEAATRIWLVLDGKTLHVDRNANGDLTDDGEGIAAKKGLDIFGEDGEYFFEVDTIHEGSRTHKNLLLTVRKLDYLARNNDNMKKWLASVPEGIGYALSIAVELPGYKGKGSEGRIRQLVSFWDARGTLRFADKPQNAPIIHFGGPWRMECLQGNRLTIGHETDLMLSLGTPGLGSGTTAWLAYADTIPDDVHPQVEITYPPLKPGDPPVKRHYEIKERC
jgi:hypothetical protein